MLNHDKLKEKRASARQQSNAWKPKELDNRIRILPTHSRYLTEEAGDVAIKFKMHFFRIGDKNVEVSLCLEELGQTCPACATWRAWKRTDDSGLKELVKSIGPSDQFLMNILDINNLPKGIQPWPANYTCWDKIIEVAANPQWGSVDDPANGINFQVTLTPAKRSHTGYNSYSVVPEPQRTNVMPVLEQLGDWKAKLDELESHKAAPKTPDEIVTILRQMGLQVPGVVGTAPAPAPSYTPQPTFAQPMPVGAPMPMATPAAPAPMTMPMPQPVGAPPQMTMPMAPAMPQPVAVAPAAPMAMTMPSPMAMAPAPAPMAMAPAPAPMAMPAAAAPAPTYSAPMPSTMPAAAPTGYTAAPAPGVFDPGPDYIPKMADNVRPAGVPRCFADYNPNVRPCRNCPVVTDCQMKYMGM